MKIKHRRYFTKDCDNFATRAVCVVDIQDLNDATLICFICGHNTFLTGSGTLYHGVTSLNVLRPHFLGDPVYPFTHLHHLVQLCNLEN